MPNDIFGRSEKNHPLYGFSNPYLSIGDFPSVKEPYSALVSVSATTTSANIPTGTRGIEIGCQFSDAATKCDLDVYRVDPGPVDTLVTTLTGLNLNSGDIFLGLAEKFDFKGYDVKVRAKNFTGGGSVSVTVKGTS